MVLGRREPQLVEEDLRELLVVVLARVDEHLLRPFAQPVGDRRRLDELRPVPDDGENPHVPGDKRAAEMESLLTSIRGTVQGVIGATDHMLWWVSWHTGDADRTRVVKR